MKKILIIFLFLSSLNLLSTSLVPKGWTKGVSAYKINKELMKQTKAPILVYVYADWCGYCVSTSKKLSKKLIVDNLKHFTKIAINGGIKSKSSQLKEVLEEFEVRGFPSMFIVYPNGKHKSIRVSSRYSDSKYLARLKYKIGKNAYRLAKKNKGSSYELKDQEIADIYSGNSTKPKVIEFSDNVGENNMRAYKVVTENSKSRFHNNTGDVYLAKKQYDKAIDQYYETIKFDSKNQRAYYSLGLAHFKVAKISKGFKRLKLLRKAKSFLKIAKTYTGSYIPAINKLRVDIIKIENKENKKYKSYK